MSIKAKIGAFLQYPLPQHAISRVIYFLTRVESKTFVPPAIKWFSKTFKVNLDEAKNPEPESYTNFNAFFTRELAPKARPIATSSTHLISPVDAHVSAIGPINGQTIFQAKGHDYSLLNLIGNDPSDAALFEDGQFATLYLSPRDYHRIHMPSKGKLKKMIHVPGRLFSVSPGTVDNVPNVFARNERVIALFDTPAGPLGMVLVGAMNVAAIETVWHGLITPPAGKKIQSWEYPEGDTYLQGEEMGRFNMGSTVILLTPNNVKWFNSLKPKTPTLLGQQIAEQAPISPP